MNTGFPSKEFVESSLHIFLAILFGPSCGCPSLHIVHIYIGMFLHYIHINQNQVNEDGEYEWGDAMDINQLGLVHNPLLLWKVQCCLSSLSTTIRREVFGPAAESDNIKREVEKPFHPNQLTSCMCEDAHNRLILMANREDLECISKQNYEQWKSQEPKKFATAPTAFFVSKMEEIAVFTEKKLELIPFDDPRWNEG